MTEKLAPRVAALEKGHAELRRNIQVIENDIAKINARLDETATKSDVAHAQMEITAEFNAGINGILRDALAAVPGKQAAAWTVVCGVAGLGALLLAVVQIIHH